MIKLVKHNCYSCEFYTKLEGICGNDDNHEWVGSWPPVPENACKFWEDKALKYHPEEFFSAERSLRRGEKEREIY